jgi:ubiquinone/menaquinone biosynthesis C-methylase UbiE
MIDDSERRICDYEGSDYQKRFWDQGEREYEDRVEEVALQRLLPPSGNRMLEIGAGAGRNTQRYKGFEEIVLLDYSYTQLQEAQRRLGQSPQYRYVVGDVYKLPFAPGVFDAATMIRTLHHMSDPQRALEQTRWVLQRGKPFILEYANKRNVKAIARWLVRKQSWNPFDLAAVEFAPLNFDFHPQEIRTWLSKAKFSLEEQLTVSHFRLPLLKRILPTSLLVSLDSALQWTGRWAQFTPSVFVLAKAQGTDSPREDWRFWRCPECKSLEVEEGHRGCRCQSCGRMWLIRDGICDFKEPQFD